MNDSQPQKRVGSDLVPLVRDLSKWLEAGNASITILPIIQLRDHAISSDEAKRLARTLGRLLTSNTLEAVEAAMPKALGKPLPREGVFRYDGRQTWEIGIGGRVSAYGNAIGFHQLQCLLRRPNQRVPVLELAEVCGHQVVIDQSCDETVTDSKALGQCREEAERLKDELDIARSTGNSDRVSQLEAEFAKLERYFGANNPYRGIKRRLANQGNKLRNRVSFTLRSSTRKFFDQDPELGEHLKSSIKLGFECGYFPLTTVIWRF